MNRLLQSLSAGAVVGLLAVAASAPAGAAPPRGVAIASSSVSPSVIAPGQSATQTITLTRKAPSGGVDIAVSGDATYNDVTGGYVHVPARAISVSFPIRVGAYDVETVVPLYAQAPGGDRIRVAQITVRPATTADQAVSELRFDDGAAVEGTTVTGTVVLRNPAGPGGVSVELWSNTSYGPDVYVPRSVVVPEGSTTATFPAYITSASTPSIVRPSAHLGTSTAVGKLVVVPPEFATGPGWVRVGAVTEAAVGIGNAPNPDGVTITLTSDTAGVSVPQSVTVPAGSPGVAFPVTVDGSVAAGSTGTITATWNGTRVSSTFTVGY